MCFRAALILHARGVGAMGSGGCYSLYNGIQGCAADLGMVYITFGCFGIALGCRFREFDIVLSHKIAKFGIDLGQKLRKSGGFQNVRLVCHKIKPYTSGLLILHKCCAAVIVECNIIFLVFRGLSIIF